MELIDGIDLAVLIKESGRSRSIRPATISGKPPWACSMPTSAAWSIVTSSPPTCWSLALPKNARGAPGCPGPAAPCSLGQQRAAAADRGALSAAPLVGERWGLVKVLDMGLARLTEPDSSDPGITQMGTLMGTPDYIAPEQAVNSRTCDIRADIYSLGLHAVFFAHRPGAVPDGTGPGQDHPPPERRSGTGG